MSLPAGVVDELERSDYEKNLDLCYGKGKGLMMAPASRNM